MYEGTINERGLPSLTLRKYNIGDLDEISRLFYETVHTVNAADYSEEQLYAWARDEFQLKNRSLDLSLQQTIIAEYNGIIVGFASMDNSGCLDLLFVGKDFQRRGVATALCRESEKNFRVIKTFASVTAKPFFEKRGYNVIKAREIERYGIALKNYEMQKINDSLI